MQFICKAILCPFAYLVGAVNGSDGFCVKGRGSTCPAICWAGGALHESRWEVFGSGGIDALAAGTGTRWDGFVHCNVWKYDFGVKINWFDDISFPY